MSLCNATNQLMQLLPEDDKLRRSLHDNVDPLNSIIAVAAEVPLLI